MVIGQKNTIKIKMGKKGIQRKEVIERKFIYK